MRRAYLLARTAAFLALLSLLCFGRAAPAHAQTASETLPDFAVVNGYYFSEAAGGDPTQGYTITNDGGIPFWDAFQQLGDVDAIGYPATNRFTWQGFVDQATQKLILQWNPATQTVNVVNIFDVLAQLGLDPQLQAKYQTPPAFDNAADAGKTWPQVVARHQAELDWNAAIKARYFADPDPIAHFGLPQSYADEGNVLVVRCQRAVFQQWKGAEPWASAGQVTIANGGDVAKALGVLPANAATPTPASSLIAGPFGDTLALTPAQQQAVRAAAAAVRQSLVAIVVPDNQSNGYFLGSGMVLDANGDILTDAHVVATSSTARVLLPNGQVTDGQVVGRDFLADVAVVHVPVSGLTPVTFGSSDGLQPGALLVSIGYSTYYPSPPALRVGQLLDSVPEQLTGATIIRVINNVANLFGDSGSPVVNLQGQVVGIFDDIGFGGDGSPQYTVDNAFQSVLPIAQRIIATHTDVTHLYVGFNAFTLTPAIAKQAGVALVAGEVVYAVAAGSSAAKAGLAPGDIVTSLDGTPTTTAGSLAAVLARHKAGDAVTLTYLTPDGKSHNATITLQQI